MGAAIAMTKLERAQAVAQKAKWDLDRRREDYRSALWTQVTELEKRLETQVEREFAAETAQVASQLAHATELVEQERIANAQAGKGEGKYKPGQVLCKWHHERWTDSWSDTKERGIVEVFTRESMLPVNTSSYSRPSIGSLVLRLLKADGTPSRKVLTSHYGGDFGVGWLPEGQKPKNARSMVKEE